MALSRNGERIMNTKRLAALVTLGALLSTAAPALAVAPTGTVNVEWNYAITATLNIYTQTFESGSFGAGSSVTPAANDIFVNQNAGTGTCNGGSVASKDGATNGPWATGTVNFGLVTADPVKYTNCLEINAIDAYIVTNDSGGGNLAVQITSAVPSAYDTAANGSLLCVLPSNTWNTTGNTAWASSARVAAVSMLSTTACSSGTAVTTASAPLLALTKATTGSDILQDAQLNMGPQMQSGAQTVTLTYTFTTN